MRRNIVSFVVALGLTVLSAGPSAADSLGPFCWQALFQDRLEATFSLVFLGNESSNAVATVAGVYLRNQDPKNALPVSGAAFRDDDRNSIKMVLTIALPAGVMLAGGHLAVEFSLDPPHGGTFGMDGPGGPGSWTLVSCP